MKQIAPLTEVEQTTLTEAYHHHPTFRVRQRAHALLLNHRGYSMARIRELFEVQHETVSRWVQRWEAEGLVGLLDQERSGRPPILDEKAVQILIDAVNENPHQLKHAHDHLQEKTGQVVSRDTVKRVLKKSLMSTSVAASLASTNGMKPPLNGIVK